MIRQHPEVVRRWLDERLADERRADEVRAAHGTGPLRRPRPRAAE